MDSVKHARMETVLEAPAFSQGARARVISLKKLVQDDFNMNIYLINIYLRVPGSV